MNSLLLILLALCFGPTFLFNKLAVLEMPMISVVCLRIVLSAILLVPILYIRGRRLPPLGPIWRHLAVMSFLATSIPFFCFTWGAWHIDVALGGLINGATPFFTLILAHLYLQDEEISSNKLMGLGIGSFGLMILFLPALTNGASGEILGGLAVLLAACSNAASYVYAKRFVKELHPLESTTAQVLIASLYIFPFYLFSGHAFQEAPSVTALSAGVANAVTGTVLAFLIFYALLKRSSATFVSLVTYLLPPIGVALGVIVMGEPLQLQFFPALMLILWGMSYIKGQKKKLQAA